ncbi:MAG: Rne/Rng family ribonuclease [Holophagales bacterium]|jgi:ribonuclease G|nr:Rne/Rng family ribonuclease [Holophagales bacterium]
MEIRRSLVVNTTPLETRIALLENGQVCEIFVERTSSVSQVGDVYKGRVAKLLPGMQSAFIAMGDSKDGFLYLDEPEAHRLTAEELDHEDYVDTAVFELASLTVTLPPVNEGEVILVQVVKDPIASKGPRLSRHISFPGRFLVFMPGIDHVGISRKITDHVERERLKELIRANSEPGEGFIVRTAAIGERDDDLISDITFLREIWKEVRARSERRPVPSIIWQDFRLLQKVLRDLFREEVSSFWVDTEESYQQVIAFVQALHPEWLERVKRFTSDIPIFEAFGIERELELACHPKYFLRNGGSIVINQTEALVSVDVNTGKFVGNKDLEETVFKTNMEAIPEIVRQLRLRNLGGIIVIDFIDMTVAEHRVNVMERLHEELTRDRNHARASAISDFGLVEMTRKRTGPSLESQFTVPCPHCEGCGHRLSPETIVLKVYREIARLGENLRGASIRITLHPNLRAAIGNDARDGLMQLAKFLGAHVLWVERTDYREESIGFEVTHPKKAAAANE